MDSIKIEDQNWSNMNLHSNEFRNGDKIDIVSNSKTWFELNQNNKPACCYYNFNENNGEKLGLLYNWFWLLIQGIYVQKVGESPQKKILKN